MNTYDKNAPGISGNSFDRWIQKNNIKDESTISKMQHQFWVTKQTLFRKLGKKEDECIVSSDAELDAKLELFRSIQQSCAFLQRVIDKYQERLCKLAQEENAMGRFLKESGKEDKTRAGEVMCAVGKSLSYSGQQRLTLRGPLLRLHQEVETFRQRAIEDTLQKVQAMEKARTEYRAALSWMKNVSQELDPDTSKQLERFRDVQTRVRRGKTSFDQLTLDCLQKIDLLAAARCNMFSHALVMYQNTLSNFAKDSTYAYSIVATRFKGHQPYDFMVVRELAETSTKLAQETGGDHSNKKKLLFFEDYNDDIQEAEEAKETEEKKGTMLDMRVEGRKIDFDFDALNSLNESKTVPSKHAEKINKVENKQNEEFLKFFDNLDSKEENVNKDEINLLDNSLTGMTLLDRPELDLSSSNFAAQGQNQSFVQLSSENLSLLNDILNSGENNSAEWDNLIGDTFLPPNILKQSLGDVLNTEKKGEELNFNESVKKNRDDKQKGNPWLDLFAELDPLNNLSLEMLSKDGDTA